METLALCVRDLSVCALVCAVVLTLVPEGSIKRTIGILAALSVLTIFIGAFTRDYSTLYSSSPMADGESSAEQMHQLNDRVLAQYEAATAEVVAELLTHSGVSDFTSEVSAVGLGEFGINIESIRIYLTDEYSSFASEVKSTVYENIGFNPEVVVRDGD